MDEGLLNDLLECSVCLERLDTSSRVLPCQHTFCIKCLKEIVQSHKELRCPECRILVEIRLEDLPPNVLLMRILEGMRGRPNKSQAPVFQTPMIPSQVQCSPSQLQTSPANHHFPSEYKQTNIAMMQLSHNLFRQKEGLPLYSNLGLKIDQQLQQDPSNQFRHMSSAQVQQVRQHMQDPNRQLTEYTGMPNASMPHARAVYDYLSKEPTDLSFKKGDIIMLRRRIDTHWYYGECGGKQGVFPITYAKVIVPLPVTATPQCKALYDFRMAAPDEDGCLAFDKGAVITVIRRVDENWAEGRLQERIGIFPIAFVEMNAPARALMKISNSVGGRSAPLAPPLEPIMGVSMLQAGQPNRMEQVPNIYRQQQMSLSSPAPVMGSSVQVPHAHPMSQSQPVPANHQSQGVQTNQPSSTNQGQSEPIQNEPDLIQLVYGSHANAAQILVQNLQAANNNKHHNADGSGQSNAAAQEAFQKARANIKQFQSLSSSYHAANNLSSDSSSSTTTHSFGGSSVTTTPNTSSSNTSSSESNTPSSPASPAYNAQNRNADKNAPINTTQHTQSSAQNYCNVMPIVSQSVNQPTSSGYSNVVIEDANTSRSHETSLESSGNTSVLNSSNHSLLNSDNNRSNTSNNSPVQNISVETPPRSNMSSPQTCINTPCIVPISIANHVSLELTSTAQNASIYQTPTNNREIISLQKQHEHIPFSNSGYTLLSNSHAPSVANPFLNSSSMDNVANDDSVNLVSPRHGRDGPLISATRSGHSSQHHHREKRHSLTPGGQTLAPQQTTTQNRHSMEYMMSGNSIVARAGPATSTDPGAQFLEQRRKGEPWREDGKRDRETIKLPAPYVALYPYKPQKADELELKKGTVYMVLERCYDGWYKGCQNGSPQKCGVFPGNYVTPAQSRSKHRSNKSSNSSEQKTSNSKPSSTNITPGSSNKKKGEGGEQSTSSSSTPQQQPLQQPSQAAQSAQSQPPDLPPRAASPTSNSNSVFPWSSTPKVSTPNTSKSSEKSKEKNKSEKTPTTMSLMKRLAAMKKCKSPPPPSGHPGAPCQNAGFSMDNPVFEDCIVPTNHQPVHVRTTGEGPWHPAGNRPQHQHRKSHSLDAGQQLRTRDSTTTRERFRCIVAYPPNSEYELELQVDDVVVVHRKWGDGWYKGTHERTGRTGLFPASFVETC